MRSADDRLSRLLEVQDETIGATLKKYALDQELGEVINELTEADFKEFKPPTSPSLSDKGHCPMASTSSGFPKNNHQETPRTKSSDNREKTAPTY